MSYLKGGSVVDGNLYVEGDLRIKGTSVGEEGLEYAYVVNPTGTIIPVMTPGSGKLQESFFVEGVEEITERNTTKSYAVISLKGMNYFKLGVNAGDIRLVYHDPGGVGSSKNCLYGFTADDIKIDDQSTGESKYKPYSEPAFWRYDDAKTFTTSLSFDSDTGMPIYTMPNAETSDIDVGETIIITGDSPIQ